MKISYKNPNKINCNYTHKVIYPNSNEAEQMERTRLI